MLGGEIGGGVEEGNEVCDRGDDGQRLERTFPRQSNSLPFHHRERDVETGRSLEIGGSGRVLSFRRLESTDAVL